jgi:hypothetical protein
MDTGTGSGEATGVRDALHAKALVLEAGGSRMAIVTMDLGSIASERMFRAGEGGIESAGGAAGAFAHAFGAGVSVGFAGHGAAVGVPGGGGGEDIAGTAGGVGGDGAGAALAGAGIDPAGLQPAVVARGRAGAGAVRQSGPGAARAGGSGVCAVASGGAGRRAEGADRPLHGPSGGVGGDELPVFGRFSG